MSLGAHTLEAEHLSKSYKSKVVVRDFSLSVKRGEVVGLLGPNGCGKTTSFYMIIGLVKPDNGSIRLDSKDISNLPIHRRARLGLSYLPQDTSVFQHLTVEQNILAVLELGGSSLSKAEKKERVDELIAEFRLDKVRDSFGISLSGGERKRVEIARTIALGPDFVLLDEPFSGVDPVSVSGVQDLINSLSQKGIGVLITDHNVRELLGICHRAYIMYDGRILISGDKSTILQDETVRRVYLGDNFIHG